MGESQSERGGEIERERRSIRSNGEEHMIRQDYHDTLMGSTWETPAVMRTTN